MKLGCGAYTEAPTAEYPTDKPWCMMEFHANRGDRWIDLNPKAAKLEHGSTGWTDMRHKVRWHTTTTELHEHLLY